MTLKSKVQKFLEISEIPKSKFCKNIGISESSLYFWLKDQRDFTAKTEERIADYLQNYVKRLIEIAT